MILESKLYSTQKVATHLLSLTLLVLLFMPTIRWITNIFNQDNSVLNSLIAICGFLFLGFKLKKSSLQHWRFNYSLLPACLVFIGIALFLWTEYAWDIDIISCVALGITLIGLCGLYTSTDLWIRLAPALLLLIFALPVAPYLETFFGFPLRLLSTNFVSDLYQAAGFNSVKQHAIMVIENRFTYIDLPCSGVKSLWSGGVFFLLFTLIEEYKLNLRWLLMGMLFIGILIATNLLRIILLVSLTLGSTPTVIQDILHQPIGLSCFLLACILCYFLMSKLLKRHQSKQKTKKTNPTLSLLGSYALLALSTSAILLYTPRPLPDQATVTTAPLSTQNILVDTSELTLEKLSLNDFEKDLYQRHGNNKIIKAGFSWKHIKGSLILVNSDTWRAQHHPEQCFAAQGGQIKQTDTVWLTQDFPSTWVKTQHSSSGYSAIYWFQSADEITQDYTHRIWSDLLHPGQHWTMATIYFNQEIDQSNKDVSNFLHHLRHQLQNFGINS